MRNPPPRGGTAQTEVSTVEIAHERSLAWNRRASRARAHRGNEYDYLSASFVVPFDPPQPMSLSVMRASVAETKRPASFHRL